MKVKEITYGRLFTLSQYNNERIEFRANIGKEENAEVALGELFTKVLNAENLLTAYRNAVTYQFEANARVEHTHSQIANQMREITSTKVSIAELTERLTKGGDVDERLRHACNRQSLQQMETTLKGYEESLREAQREVRIADALVEEVQKRLKAGNFSVEGLDLPLPRRYME